MEWRVASVKCPCLGRARNFNVLRGHAKMYGKSLSAKTSHICVVCMVNLENGSIALTERICLCFKAKGNYTACDRQVFFEDSLPDVA